MRMIPPSHGLTSTVSVKSEPAQAAIAGLAPINDNARTVRARVTTSHFSTDLINNKFIVAYS